MNAETINLLAQKLHIPAKILKETIIHQAHIAAVSDALWTVLWIVMFGVALTVAIILLAKQNKVKDKWDDAFGLGIGGIVLCPVALMFVTFAGLSCYEFFTALANPLYWGMADLLSKLAGC